MDINEKENLQGRKDLTNPEATPKKEEKENDIESTNQELKESQHQDNDKNKDIEKPSTVSEETSTEENTQAEEPHEEKISEKELKQLQSENTKLASKDVDDTEVQQAEGSPTTDSQVESELKNEEKINDKVDTESEKKINEQPSDDEKGDKNDKVDDDEHEEEEHQLDYSNYTKKQMVQVLESLLKEDDFSQVGKILKEIKKPFDDLVEQEREDAYNAYIEEGGEKDGFEYRGDELDLRFRDAFGKLRERKNKYFNSLEIQKEQNLKTKLDILEKLRELVDSEETGASIKDLKDLQTQWKEVGPVPSSQLKSLWANYNALLDRFYDNRSIYFELKELDRKKNYDLKIELCEKAEELTKQENIREVIKQLNELHEEFKHIGPVPKEDQEAVWERFKAASDQIYAKRKDYYENLKQELKINQVAKEALVEKVLPFAEFNSEKFSDWNSKTKEIIAIQKEWEAIGSLPKEKAKKINKQFWSAFKSFFNSKGLFFKKIEEERKKNLQIKQELVDKAESLKDSEDFKQTSEELKRLQKEWKNIGPVPEKFRNEIFSKFKKACDHFFDRRRANSEVIEKEYVENLKAKESLCEEMEKMAKSEEVDIDRIKKIEAEWAEIGYVPRNSIRTIQKRYTEIIERITEMMDLSEEEIHKLRFKAQFGNMNFGPGSERVIQKKEGALRRQISNLENDISLWRNNIDFFASSKNADKLKKDFQVKIDKANAQLKNLKEQLKIISNI
jgi:hypothetical protein